MGRHWQLLHIKATLWPGAGTGDTAAAGAAASTPTTGGVAATIWGAAMSAAGTPDGAVVAAAAETAAAGESSVAEKGRLGGMLLQPMGLQPEQHQHHR